MITRILLGVAVLVHVSSVAVLIWAVLSGGTWRPIGAALVGVVAGAVWVLALHEQLGEQEARDAAAAGRTRLTIAA